MKTRRGSVIAPLCHATWFGHTMQNDALVFVIPIIYILHATALRQLLCTLVTIGAAFFQADDVVYCLHMLNSSIIHIIGYYIDH